VSAIVFEEVTKSYPCYQRALRGLKGSLLHLPSILSGFKKDRFLALDQVSFTIRAGESLGIVGANGSGKSTALAIIAGVLRPQLGRVLVRGRIGPLLELGAGFHPELSGRQNILLNGVLLGLSRKEVQAKEAEIIAFSEIEPFLDQPLRTFSTGMIARLGFSVAVHVDPEILLIDETLSVGDFNFQEKCRRKIAEFKRRGTTIVMVSHALQEVQDLCDRVLWLHRGRLVAQGEPSEILHRYQAASGPRA
jgi:lipopolysaccharide transport system ATP-binding protein